MYSCITLFLTILHCYGPTYHSLLNCIINIVLLLSCHITLTAASHNFSLPPFHLDKILLFLLYQRNKYIFNNIHHHREEEYYLNSKSCVVHDYYMICSLIFPTICSKMIESRLYLNHHCKLQS